MDPSLHHLFDGAAKQLCQLQTTVLSLHGVYTRESQALPGSTIGKHVRHVLDHFSLLFAAIQGPRPFAVNYAHRERNQATQESIAVGIASLAAMSVTTSRLRERLRLHASDTVMVSDTMPGGNDAEFVSSVGRELWFCIHHMIHHNAVIASLMHEFGLRPPTEFAYAPSTLKRAE
ncbi:hypothetical protein EV174_001572 [Coemansia sp. RSA 2320]|nr:hypothetical protein EV174_001572 [Coemansia sp. RSA 2320]